MVLARYLVWDETILTRLEQGGIAIMWLSGSIFFQIFPEFRGNSPVSNGIGLHLGSKLGLVDNQKVTLFECLKKLNIQILSYLSLGFLILCTVSGVLLVKQDVIRVQHKIGLL